MGDLRGAIDVGQEEVEVAKLVLHRPVVVFGVPVVELADERNRLHTTARMLTIWQMPHSRRPWPPTLGAGRGRHKAQRLERLTDGG